MYPNRTCYAAYYLLNCSNCVLYLVSIAIVQSKNKMMKGIKVHLCWCSSFRCFCEGKADFRNLC